MFCKQRLSLYACFLATLSDPVNETSAKLPSCRLCRWCNSTPGPTETGQIETHGPIGLRSAPTQVGSEGLACFGKLS